MVPLISPSGKLGKNFRPRVCLALPCGGKVEGLALQGREVCKGEGGVSESPTHTVWAHRLSPDLIPEGN